VHLVVPHTNVRAIGFYRHLGFTQVPGIGAMVFAMDLTG
jgi:ribosomal protein S18 acetylase RimI-like enzyme